MKASLLAIFLTLFTLTLQAKAMEPPPPAVLPTVEAIAKINLNTASAKELTHSFQGIGKKRAEAIVHYRDANGEFKSVAELANVRGLGRNFVKKYLAQLQQVYGVA